MIQRAVILSTGDELTTGKVVDTNANYIADQINQIGLDLVSEVTRSKTETPASSTSWSTLEGLVKLATVQLAMPSGGTPKLERSGNVTEG